ncbi:MAG: methyltransferase domain-containing protein [Ignavibacteriaceae bacterium]|nr:methyltransferase domain-containing protein [Ignavibacteriaceae bacterium]
MQEKYCCLCGSNVKSFLPWEAAKDYPFIDLLKCIGSDIINFYCPNCRSTDRDRHLWLYLNKIGVFDALNSETKIMHIAPEAPLISRLLKKTSHIVAGDLFPEKYAHVSYNVQKVDLTDINAQDNYFNLFIANHILEHIIDYKKALKEINRILINSGIAILQTPYSPVIYRNFEDPMINTDELRELYYGQSNHVRVFGIQLFDDIKEAGFNVSYFEHGTILKDIDPNIYGVNAREGLIVAIKNN